MFVLSYPIESTVKLYGQGHSGRERLGRNEAKSEQQQAKSKQQLNRVLQNTQNDKMFLSQALLVSEKLVSRIPSIIL